MIIYHHPAIAFFCILFSMTIYHFYLLVTISSIKLFFTEEEIYENQRIVTLSHFNIKYRTIRSKKQEIEVNKRN